MKIELEERDKQEIALTVVEMLRPLLHRNGKAEDIIFDKKGLSRYLGVEVSWIDKKVSYKEIPYFKIGKYVRFKKAAIDKWVDRKMVSPIPQCKMVKTVR